MIATVEMEAAVDATTNVIVWADIADGTVNYWVSTCNE